MEEELQVRVPDRVRGEDELLEEGEGSGCDARREHGKAISDPSSSEVGVDGKEDVVLEGIPLLPERGVGNSLVRKASPPPAREADGLEAGKPLQPRQVDRQVDATKVFRHQDGKEEDEEEAVFFKVLHSRSEAMPFVKTAPLLPSAMRHWRLHTAAYSYIEISGYTRRRDFRNDSSYANTHFVAQNHTSGGQRWELFFTLCATAERGPPRRLYPIEPVGKKHAVCLAYVRSFVFRLMSV